MTSPTPRKTVRLGTLLSGNRKPKIELASDLHSDVSTDDFLDSIETSGIIDYDNNWTTGDSSPLRIELNNQKISCATDDVHLPQREPPHRTSLPFVGDCEIIAEPGTPKLTVKQILSGKSQPGLGNKKTQPSSKTSCSKSEDLEVIHISDSGKNRETHERIMSGLTCTKKTSVKKLFDNFQKRNRNQEEYQEIDEVELVSTTPVKPLHEVSSLDSMETPLPASQNVTDNTDYINARPLSLKKKNKSAPELVLNFDPHEYKSLNLSNKQSKTALQTLGLEASGRRCSNKIWTEDFEPHDVENVILNDNLKRDVHSWLDKAFKKLRKKTTRNKLRKKKVEADDEMDFFVVDDDLEEGDEQEEEFVPLMILSGEAVGKTTLLKSLMNSYSGQIFEINASGNRGKRDFLQSVLDFSTTHYVKDKGSKGLILFDDVDVLFRERDKLFWNAVEKLLIKARRPVVLICRDINYIPLNILQVAQEENSLFQAKAIDFPKAVDQLQQFLTSRGLLWPREFLEHIIKLNMCDIRKCLMELQWMSLSDHTSERTVEPVVPPQDIASALFSSTLLSEQDVILRGIQWKSNLEQDRDSTVYFASKSKDFVSFSDEQKLAFDYMVDYKQHLHDSLKRPLMPFEMDVTEYLRSRVFDPNEQQECGNHIFQKAAMETIHYLKSRVSETASFNEDHGGNARMTRNSRKVKEIMDRFSENGDHVRSSFNDYFMNLTSVMTRSQICQDVIPLVCEVAKHDKARKAQNRLIYQNAMTGVPPENEREVVIRLLQEHAFYPIWFKGEPDLLLSAWSFRPL
ncbi:Elg1p [Lachancea thermotolerans CBS 6340]|uniref:KLTH0G02552p n=1 Tax=Lachancea thermotolerans (strain ATCC 56472 / CBS 6340 / NRRL Y-8284) TaxID=559295 RepID=C5DLQ1_LACTC|nr:KLTH0G02552p [Lachancea thermotolerans CBS 6340]CAR24712.1 KLTH0G02552p [Lachancea thermotolerans CBS 6340]